ncbi:Beta-galactosidase BgaP [compost metagenome]
MQRKKNGVVYTFALNHNKTAASIQLDTLAYLDLLTGQRQTGTVELAPYGVMILQQD